MATWVVVLVVVWLICWLICWRMGRETGRNGLLFGLLGPLGVLLLAFLPSRKEQSAAVERLEGRGMMGLAVRRRNLNTSDPGVGMGMGAAREQIREDVTEGGAEDGGRE
jgi:hypothetical protein